MISCSKVATSLTLPNRFMLAAMLPFPAARLLPSPNQSPLSEAKETVDCSGLLVAPGMIDLHVHVYWGVSHYGIWPDDHCVAKGVTTAVDAGSAGADTFPGFRKFIIEASATRLFATPQYLGNGYA